MDSLLYKQGIHASPISISRSVEGRTHPVHVCALGRSGDGASTKSNGILLEKSNAEVSSQIPSSSSRFPFMFPFRPLWPEDRNGKPNDDVAQDDAVVFVGNGEVNGGDRPPDENENKNQNQKEPLPSSDEKESWVMKILRVKSLWSEESERDDSGVEKLGSDEVAVSTCSCGEDSGDCGVDGENEQEGQAEQEIKFDKDSFSRLLCRVPLAETKLYARMSYLGNMAYNIPKIKPAKLLKFHGLRFVTSSIEKRMQSKSGKEKMTPAQFQEPENESDIEGQMKKKILGISASTAYQVVASAASYMHAQTKRIPPFMSSEVATGVSPGDRGSNDDINVTSSEEASFMATTNSVTAVVAAKEERKQAVAKDLNSANSNICEWFICDDDRSGTRFFVIQGSESMASWQANLLFEPIQFEGLDVLVHRGIYETAKGIYEQMLPEVHAHLKSHGDSATFRFTGHSLGGSLSLLVNLMLLIRGEVSSSSLLPVITFGAPSIMCGGDQLLQKFGLPQSHVKAITLHRDIVPRAFSCMYPNQIAGFLKALNSNFSNHPCLKDQKLLYEPMGELLILQPEDNFSPNHHLLPTGSGLYLLKGPRPDSSDAEKQLCAAKTEFLNSPHPLEILSDLSAYGSNGAIFRDHDVRSYLKCVHHVLRQELHCIRKAKREQRRQMWWLLVAPKIINAGISVDKHVASGNMSQWARHLPSWSGIFRDGRPALKRFSRLVASQHLHLLVLLLFPLQLLLRTNSQFGFH